MKENNIMFNLKIFENMKRTGTLTTPDGKVCHIELNDPKKGVLDYALEAGFHVSMAALSVITSWAIGKGLEKLDKKS